MTTIKATSEAASSGILSFLNISAFIGVNLAVFNLLPIPALDGSKVVFCIIEWIRKKPINRKVEAKIHFIGIIFLFGFAILVDFLQLFVLFLYIKKNPSCVGFYFFKKFIWRIFLFRCLCRQVRLT